MTEFEKAIIEVKKELIDRITTVYEHEYEYSTVSGECDEFYQDVINIIRSA